MDALGTHISSPLSVVTNERGKKRLVINLKVFSLSIHNNIKLEPEWIPRSLNERADLLSRIVDYDDWMLNPVVFAEVDRLWGPHSVDRFANWQNCQTTRFNSRCWSPGSEAFTVDWGKENVPDPKNHTTCTSMHGQGNHASVIVPSRSTDVERLSLYLRTRESRQ